ncbi:MAG: hypothetical protein H5U13_12755 [Parvibaculum sp.]|nr:hypothetical protein [Parvibaculum sp.]
MKFLVVMLHACMDARRVGGRAAVIRASFITGEVLVVDGGQLRQWASLEHFPVKWTPVDRRKCGQTKEAGA